MKDQSNFAFGQDASGAPGNSGPVTCLGITFDNDEVRRAHFTEELRKKLQDPDVRKIEGFPIGSDEFYLVEYRIHHGKHMCCFSSVHYTRSR